MGQAAHAGTVLLRIGPGTPGPTYPEMKVLPAAEGLAVALKGLHHQAPSGPSCGRPEAQHTGLRLEDPLRELKHRGRCASDPAGGRPLPCGSSARLWMWGTKNRKRSLHVCKPVAAGMLPRSSQQPLRAGPRVWVLPRDGDGSVGWPPCLQGRPGVPSVGRAVTGHSPGPGLSPFLGLLMGESQNE